MTVMEDGHENGGVGKECVWKRKGVWLEKEKECGWERETKW